MMKQGSLERELISAQSSTVPVLRPRQTQRVKNDENSEPSGRKRVLAQTLAHIWRAVFINLFVPHLVFMNLFVPLLRAAYFGSV
jgi:hypothetical protein